MLGGSVVVDAVVHPFNIGPENRAAGAEPQLEALYGAHRLAFGDCYGDYVLSRDEFFSDFSYDAVADALRFPVRQRDVVVVFGQSIPQ